MKSNNMYFKCILYKPTISVNTPKGVGLFSGERYLTKLKFDHVQVNKIPLIMGRGSQIKALLHLEPIVCLKT